MIVDVKASAMASKSFDPKERAAVQALVRRIVDEDFDGVTTRAAKKFGVSQPYLSDIISGAKGAGMKLLKGLHKHTGFSFEQLLGREPIRARSVAIEVELDPRYPNRERAIQSLSSLLQIESAEVRRFALLALDADEDPDAEWWFEQIKAAIKRDRRGAAVGQRVSTKELD